MNVTPTGKGCGNGLGWGTGEKVGYTEKGWDVRRDGIGGVIG